MPHSGSSVISTSSIRLIQPLREELIGDAALVEHLDSA
jgi:hypothetical protein